jgi:hypothetical protein
MFHPQVTCLMCKSLLPSFSDMPAALPTPIQPAFLTTMDPGTNMLLLGMRLVQARPRNRLVEPALLNSCLNSPQGQCKCSSPHRNTPTLTESLDFLHTHAFLPQQCCILCSASLSCVQALSLMAQAQTMRIVFIKSVYFQP